MARTWDFIAKIVMIGDSGCGKSSLTIRLTDDRFSPTHDVTLAAEIGAKVIPVGENEEEKLKLQIWDTAGQEHFRSVTKSYFRNAAGCILVYDITRRETLDHAKQWLDDVRAQSTDEQDISICLVGNKTDLDQDRQVTTEEAESWAQEHGIEQFVETSAKTGDQVVYAYTQLAKQIHAKIIQGQYDLNDKTHGIKVNQNSAGQINLAVNKQKQSSSCC